LIINHLENSLLIINELRISPLKKLLKYLEIWILLRIFIVLRVEGILQPTNKTLWCIGNQTKTMSKMTLKQTESIVGTETLEFPSNPISGIETLKFPLVVKFQSAEEMFESIDNYLFEILCDCMLSKITNKPLLNQDGSHVEVDSPILVLSYDGEEDCQVLRYSDTLIENSYPNVLNNLIKN
jgi:hypothetical protein